MDLRQDIKLGAPEEVRDFVSAAAKCAFDVDISYNRFIIDAKSLLGVLSMDLTKILTVSCMGYDCQFEQTLNKYAV
ncbi:hypothetical protein EDD66_1119 [Mobilisporobacter senegalensis]|uniref:PTS HPr component family protein n=1 Tax=Mobilisporobacter senegalensis TaxID=1329262 RepID=A0A3N1XGK0_9FIRM|nr:HPr family phosphocarrier protein [Mobilisporobacter senegalensis]ROR25248.1 hypothetical protein EDD66_1119 [Mobilisporobacter senegalensis]